LNFSEAVLDFKRFRPPPSIERPPWENIARNCIGRFSLSDDALFGYYLLGKSREYSVPLSRFEHWVAVAQNFPIRLLEVGDWLFCLTSLFCVEAARRAFLA
jgi:hypothetical protein